MKTLINTNNGVHEVVIIKGSLINELAKWYSMPDETLGNFLTRIASDIDKVMQIYK
jgi:hypothetical protein